MTAAGARVEEVVRDSWSRLVAYLSAWCGSIALAEDGLGDAVASALDTWPRDGVPSNPEAWLVTAAKRRVIGHLRRADTAMRATRDLALVEDERSERLPAGPIPDRRLELMFVCAHPAIDAAIRAPLMLQTVLRLDAARIASAFLVSPATMGQRLTRAKRKIERSRIPFRIPSADERPGRTTDVLDAIYAAYGTGWDDPDLRDPRRRGLTEEAVRLARILVELDGGDPEVLGLLALMLHCEARREARRVSGRFVPLLEQDPDHWDRSAIDEADGLLRAAGAHRVIGMYQLMAAIQSAHNGRQAGALPDWDEIGVLYDGLLVVAPSIGATVAAAAAGAAAGRPARALDLLEGLDPGAVVEYQPYWVTLARVLHDLGRSDDATRATNRAIGLTEDPAVREHLLAGS